MLCLSDSIRHDDPDVQQGLHAVEHAQSLTALLLAAWSLARLVTVDIVEAVLAQRALHPTSWPACPACGKRLHSKGLVKREITSIVGLIRWRRRVGRCPEGCEIGHVAPLDEDLGLQPHQRTSAELQALGCALAVFVPFATAARLLSWSSACAVSPRAVWKWVQAAGHEAMTRLQAQLEALASGNGPAAAPLEAELACVPLAIGGDGVMVPFRPQEGWATGKTKWREVKVGVLARLAPHRTRAGEIITRLSHRRLVAVLGDIDAFKPRLWLEALRQGILSAPEVVWLSDGGRGLWRLYDERFRGQARGILDFYHAAQYLWKGAAAWLDGRTTQARKWFSWSRHRLRHGDPEAVLDDLLEALEVETLPEQAKETLVKLYGYLSDHRDHIDYARYKELGLPLGSGMVESACKWLIQQRFKGVGMRWSEEGFNHLLHLRLAWVNGSFETLFQVEFEASPN